jgi:hypothetical protein
MSVALDFVKGHCGWDAVTLLPEGQIPASEELDAALEIVSAPLDGGLEVGWLGSGDRADEIRVRMVSSTAKDWIPMCGGMTQVIGKALIETFLRDRFGIEVRHPTVNVKLLTTSGEIPLRIEVRQGKAISVTTTMDNYLSLLYRDGIERLCLEGVDLLRVGTYAVIDMALLERSHRTLDFTRRDFGPHLDVVHEVLRAFRRHLGTSGVNGMLYDARPDGPGHFRVFPRFYSDDLAAARLPWEFQCGTGGIAVAVALTHQGHIPVARGAGKVILEWGSCRATPDPYGIRTSTLTLAAAGSVLTRAAFTHSVVEILAEGRLTLPCYRGERGSGT